MVNVGPILLLRSLLLSALTPSSLQYYPEGHANGKSMAQLMAKGDPHLVMDERQEWKQWKREDDLLKGEHCRSIRCVFFKLRVPHCSTIGSTSFEFTYVRRKLQLFTSAPRLVRFGFLLVWGALCFSRLFSLLSEYLQHIIYWQCPSLFDPSIPNTCQGR